MDRYTYHQVRCHQDCALLAAEKIQHDPARLRQNIKDAIDLTQTEEEKEDLIHAFEFILREIRSKAIIAGLAGIAGEIGIAEEVIELLKMIKRDIKLPGKLSEIVKIGKPFVISKQYPSFKKTTTQPQTSQPTTSLEDVFPLFGRKWYT